MKKQNEKTKKNEKKADASFPGFVCTPYPAGAMIMPPSYQADNMTPEEDAAGVIACMRMFRLIPEGAASENAASVTDASGPAPATEAPFPDHEDGDDPMACAVGIGAFDEKGNRRPDPPKGPNVWRRRRETKKQLKRRLAEEAVARGKLKDALAK